MKSLLNVKFLWALHRYVGIISCLGVLAWALSGVMHPIMSRLQPKPKQFMPPKQSIHLGKARSIVSILRQHNVLRVAQVGVVELNEKTYYRVQMPLENAISLPARYFATIDGEEWRDGDRLYAEFLARHYLGLSHTSASTGTASQFVTHFSDDYHRVNRLLPVWRIDLPEAKGTRAYIDTEQARLVTLSNDTRESLTLLFRWLHTASFLGETSWWRVAILSVLLVAIFISGVSGFYFYLRFRSNAERRLKGSGSRAWRRWHRRIGIVVSLTAITWSFSGTYHLWHGWLSGDDATPLAEQKEGFSLPELELIASHAMTDTPISRLSFVRVGDKVMCLITRASVNPYAGNRARVAELASASDEHKHHHDKPKKIAMLDSTEVWDIKVGQLWSEGIQGVAKKLALSYSGNAASQVKSVEWITKFGGEYGFLNKRLPVYRVAFEGVGHPRYYVEPATGVLATKVDDADELEGKSFSYLHKWHFFDMDKDIRDILSGLWALMNVAVAVLGCMLFFRTPSSKNR